MLRRLPHRWVPNACCPMVSFGNICRLQCCFLIELLCIHPVYTASCETVVGWEAGTGWCRGVWNRLVGWQGLLFFSSEYSLTTTSPGWTREAWQTLEDCMYCGWATIPSIILQKVPSRDSKTCVFCKLLLLVRYHNTYLPSSGCVLSNCSPLQFLWASASSAANSPACCTLVFTPLVKFSELTVFSVVRRIAIGLLSVTECFQSRGPQNKVKGTWDRILNAAQLSKNS